MLDLPWNGAAYAVDAILFPTAYEAPPAAETCGDVVCDPNARCSPVRSTSTKATPELLDVYTEEMENMERLCVVVRGLDIDALQSKL